MSESETPPQTGHPAIDEALGVLDPSAPLAEQSRQYAEAVEVLQRALNSPPETQ